MFARENWFEHYFGFKESLENVMSFIKVEELITKNNIISMKNNKIYNAGLFNLRSPSDFINLPKFGKGKLFVVHGNGSSQNISNVLFQQNDNDFDGATFLCASNFNCLEFPNINCSAGTLGISGYSNDFTQGPILSSACPGAICYRNYFVKHYDNNNKIYFGQVKKEIELLKKTPIKVCHGKALIKNDEELKNLNFDWENEDNYMIGVHENCGVYTNCDQNGLLKESEPNKIVHQVFASTFAFDSYVKRTPLTYKIASCILKSEYKSTILAALDHSIRYPNRKGSNKCVLTLLGGGAFLNPSDIIINAIKSNKKPIIDSGLNVYVMCFNSNIFEHVFPLLESTCKETGGSEINIK